MRIKYIYLSLSIILFFFLLSSCDGLFPTQNKTTVPADHTINHGGALHKEGLNQPFEECTQCHGNDLKGGIYNENGIQVVCASCYQCHDAVWKRTSGGGGYFKPFIHNEK